MNNLNQFWKRGSIKINTGILPETSKNSISISEEGFRDLGQVIKNNENLTEFLDFLKSGKSVYNFPPGTFCK